MTQRRLSISIPEELSEAIKERVENNGEETTTSAFIERAVREYIEGKRTTAYYEQQLTVLQQVIAIKEDNTAASDENIAQLEHELVDKGQAIAGLEQTLEQARASIAGYEEQTTKLKRQHEDEMTYTVQEHERQQKELQDVMAKLKADGENHQRALAAQERRHKDAFDEEGRRHEAVTNALRHEQELTQSKLEATERELQIEREHACELRDDKEQLQKQLELITLRLPAPKEGFWSRVFGRGKKEQES